MGRVRTYRDDDILKPILDALPRRKQGEITRKALYDYFFNGNQIEMPMHIVQPMQIQPQTNLNKKQDINLPPVKEFNFDLFED